MDTTSSTGAPPGASSDFMLGQMAQSIAALREETAHMREDLRSLASNYVTRPEFDKLAADVLSTDTAVDAMVESVAGRKVLDRLFMAACTAVAGGIGAAICAAIIKPGLLT